MNPKYEILGNELQHELRKKVDNIRLIEVISNFMMREIITLGEPIRDGMEELKGPLEDLTLSILIEQILVLWAHSRLEKEFKEEERRKIKTQVAWKIRILINLIDKYSQNN